MRKTVYGGGGRSTSDTSTGPSHAIWGSCPWAEMVEDPAVGYYFWDDFVNFSQHDAAADNQKYEVYIDTGVQIEAYKGTSGVGGAIEVSGNDADNDEGIIATHNPAFMVSDTAADAKTLWFEARVKKASIADNALAFFVGLGYDHGSSVTIADAAEALVDDTGALGAFTFLGFHVDQANGDAIDAVYKAEAQAQTVNSAGVHVPVADTYVKLGFIYNPAFPATQRIKWFVDGVEDSTYVTSTNIAAATFPDAEPMGLVLATKVGAAAESKFQMDWWRCAQLR